jgi:hypothetical protein
LDSPSSAANFESASSRSSSIMICNRFMKVAYINFMMVM